jgi:hypothetical protein
VQRQARCSSGPQCRELPPSTVLRNSGKSSRLTAFVQPGLFRLTSRSGNHHLTASAFQCGATINPAQRSPVSASARLNLSFLLGGERLLQGTSTPQNPKPSRVAADIWLRRLVYLARRGSSSVVVRSGSRGKGYGCEN